MKTNILLPCVLIILTTGVGTTYAADSAANKAFVEKAVKAVFVDRDASAVDKYWSKDYVQHNPGLPSGSDVVKGFVPNFPKGYKYEMGMVAADGDIVMIHGRFSGFGPKPNIVVDIYRVKDKKLVEHWDVVQEEVPATATKSGNPMFDQRE